MRPKQLTDRHRPARLADIVGQGYVVSELERFAENPYPCALLFSGPTGTGKTSAALALANELGVNLAADLIQVDSGELDGDTLDWVKQQLRFYPMHGWRVVIFEEADMMTPKAERLLNSMLEPMPTRTVIIFTTNRPEWFATPDRQRLLDRMEHREFESDAAMLRQDAELLAARVWHAETGQPTPPALDWAALEVDGALSFRRVVAALEAPLRAFRGTEAPRFTLAAPKQAPPSLLAACGPFGRKPAPADPIPLDDAPPAPPSGGGNSTCPTADDPPRWARDAGNLATFKRAVAELGDRDVSALAWIDAHPGPPTVQAVTRRFSIGHAHARRLIESVWAECEAVA